MTTLDTLRSHPVDAERVAAARSLGLTADHASALAGTLSLLSEPTRLRILYALDQVDELCVGDLALALDVGEDATSYALRLLRTAGLVAQRKAGRSVYYRLAPDFPEPLLEHCLRRLVDLSATTPHSSYRTDQS
jgi:DNA-binding transcriptional ArsR family regulator